MAISIEADKRGLIVRTPYSSMFVSELKRLIPQTERQFDGSSKVWIVTPQHGSTIQKIIMSVFREAVHVPAMPKVQSKLDHVELRVDGLSVARDLSHPFDFVVTAPEEEIVLVCELRASTGHAFFQTDSLRLIRVSAGAFRAERFSGSATVSAATIEVWPIAHRHNL